MAVWERSGEEGGDGTPKGTVGVKRKPSERTRARHKKRQKAQVILLEDSPDRPAKPSIRRGRIRARNHRSCMNRRALWT